MNLNITLPIFHLLTSLVMITAAAFAYLSDRKSFTNRLIAILLVLLGLSSFGVSLELNALTPQQALPWFALEVFSVYALSTATFIIALMLFVPKIGNKPIVRLIGIAIIVVPLLLIMIDLMDLSIPLVGQHFIVDVNKFSAEYSSGYAEIQHYADGPVQVGLFWLRNISYGIIIFYPLLYVIWRDRNTDRFNSSQALIMLSATLISAVINIAFIDLMPITVGPLISTLLFGVAFTIISVRTSETVSRQGRSLDFFQNINMFNKLLLIVMGIILPAMIFIGFSIYSFLSNTLVERSSRYVNDFAKSQAELISGQLDNYLREIEQASVSDELQDLYLTSNQEYADMSAEQIDEYLLTNEEVEAFLEIPQLEVSVYPALSALMDNNPEIQSVTLIDNQGGLISSTDIGTRFDYRDLPWWGTLMGQYTAHIGVPVWNDVHNSYFIRVMIPVVDQTGNFAGAIENIYSLENILLFLEDQSAVDLVYGINIANSNLILSKNRKISTFQIPFQKGPSATTLRNWNIIEIDDRYVISSSRPIFPGIASNQLDWKISSHQPLDSALDTLYTFRAGLVVITIGIIIITMAAILFLARGVSKPLQELTEAAETLLGGNFEVDIRVTGQDEVGTLAETLSLMATELNDMINNLESTVESRTKDLQRRTLQMETSAQVARQAAEIRDLQSLLNQTVNLISESFDFYHSGIFLLDNAGRYAVLQAASSPGGQRMLARGHRLQVGKVGVVGYTAGSGLPRISQDVGADAVYYDNPDMPQTRSELALPLIVRNNIIGVLDVQSTEPTAFSSEDVDVLQTLADQIALAIDNVRLLQSSQRALDELQRLYGQRAGQAWRQKLTGQQIAYQFTPTGLEEGYDKTEVSLQNRPGYKLRKEIKFRGQVIGNLNLMREQDDASWSEEEESLVDEILEQTALALENARLVDQIRLGSDQIRLLQEISAISSEVLDEDKLLPIITEKLHSSLAVSHCGVVLLNNLTATLISNAGDVAGKPEIGTSIAIEDDPLTQRLIRNKEVDVFNIDAEDEVTLAFTNTFSIPESKTLIFLPILVREQTVGYFYLEEITPDREIASEEFNLFNQLTTQISTALENIRLFEETANRAERERQVADITAKIRSSNDPKSILQTAVLELKKALNVPHSKTKDDVQTTTPSPTGD
jgi:GAF domain-containing protein/HAMP domain-containing protein